MIRRTQKRIEQQCLLKVYTYYFESNKIGRAQKTEIPQHAPVSRGIAQHECTATRE